MRKKGVSRAWGTCIVLYRFYHEGFCEITISRDFVVNMLGWADPNERATSIGKTQINNPATHFEINWYKKKQSEKLKSFLCLFQFIIDSPIECLMLSASWHGVLRILHKNKMDCTQLHTHNPNAAPFVLPWINFSYYIFFLSFAALHWFFSSHLLSVTFITQSFLMLAPPTPFLLFNLSLMRYLILLVLFQTRLNCIDSPESLHWTEEVTNISAIIYPSL